MSNVPQPDQTAARIKPVTFLVGLCEFSSNSSPLSALHMHNYGTSCEAISKNNKCTVFKIKRFCRNTESVHHTKASKSPQHASSIYTLNMLLQLLTVRSWFYLDRWVVKWLSDLQPSTASVCVCTVCVCVLVACRRLAVLMWKTAGLLQSRRQDNHKWKRSHAHTPVHKRWQTQSPTFCPAYRVISVYTCVSKTTDKIWQCRKIISTEISHISLKKKNIICKTIVDIFSLQWQISPYCKKS